MQDPDRSHTTGRYEGGYDPSAKMSAVGNALNKPTTAVWFANENDRLIKDAHESLSVLAAKLSMLMPRASEARVGPERPGAPVAASELSAQLREQNACLQSLIERLHEITAAVDL